MKIRPKYIIITLSTILVLIFSASYILMHTESKSLMRKIDLSEIKTTQKHENLEKSSEVVHVDNGTFSLFQSFKIDSKMELKLKLGENDYYKYYINKSNIEVINGEYTIETKNDGSSVKFIALQGDKVAKVRLKDDKKWFDSLEIPYQSNSSSSVPIEIKWDPKGKHELIVFPIRHDREGLYSGNNLTLLRAALINGNLDLNNQNVAIDSQKEIPSGMPIPSLMNSQGKTVNVVINEKSTRASEKYSAIKLKEINYNTNIDIILLNESGKSELLASKVPVLANQETIINLPENLIERVQNEINRNFLLILNNREEKQVLDIIGIINKQKSYPTTFSLVIELFKF